MAIEIFGWVDKNSKRIDHNPLDNAESAEVLENNPPSDNVAETAVIIPDVQAQIQPQNYITQQNQAFAPVPAVQNVGYVNYNPYAQEYDYSVSPQQIAEVGVDFTTARSLAAKMVKHSVELQNLYLKNIENERHE